MPESIRERLAAQFDPSDVRQFEGRGGKTFDYIEDETVMDRLDEVLGIGNWSLAVEPISVADGIVKVRLEAIVEGKGVQFEDFGYANNTNGEALKEAVSDGVRRCGRFLGVGRYLYVKHGPSHSEPRQSGGRVPPPARPPARPYVDGPLPQQEASRGSDLPAEPDWMNDGREGADDSTCPEHNEPWKGDYGDRYHKKAEGGYCRIAVGNVPKPRRAA